LPTAAWTAYVALYEKARIRSGEVVLVTAGAGGVGGFAIQLAKLAGATVIATCSAKNFDIVKKLGADYAIDYNTEGMSIL
jgi:NADPH:quinone reductase-like Zn-dependent oxidoreductase